ncbi:S9 family peptidase [Luteibacter sp.]|uniref:alpha/beta hydrolase family protein n=1 Tax=Luteibacter sp. TaxID=1886636 RepID=UPI0028091FA1|nr:S9 family peptidase [Luteibacter sp.]MDQ8051357.1 S9 family peptidase [Luteibacter sp.]
MKRAVLLVALVALMPVAPIVPVMAAGGGIDVGAYVKNDEFTDVKLSPGGEYYAATVPLADRTALAVIERGTNKITATFKLGRNQHVADFDWISRERLLISLADRFGELEEPRLTGELVAMNADGSKTEMLAGFRVDDGGLGTTIKPKKGSDSIAAFPIAAPYNETNRVALVEVLPFNADPYPAIENIDVFTGRRARVAISPVRAANFYTDNRGEVRFVSGSESDNVRKLYYRSGAGESWTLFGTQDSKGRFEYPIGFSADDKVVYLRAQQAKGPDKIIALDLASRERKVVLGDDNVDPARIIYRNGTRIPLGAFFMDGKPRTAFIDEKVPEAKLYHSLESAFAGNSVEVTSQTADGSLALIRVSSDVNPGDFYLFDTVNKKAAHVLARRQWFDPDKMAPMQPVKLAARDGLELQGYLTTPKGSSGKGLPLVVMPHGGPFGIQDEWGFNDEAQMLADAGYAVLQLNYRGSGGYGLDFRQAGAQQWGGTMQDDLTDATHWAIAQGVANKDRICLYGASYGGYAALMGVAKEPDLYRCAAGYVGVYDLPKMVADDKRTLYRWGNWSADWVGKAADLGAVSPNRMAERIKVPVFLAAGGEDETAPIEHSKLMEQALRKAGKQVETLYFDTEGHGFYLPEHRSEYYTRLLAFLSRSLGGAVASTGAGTGEAKTAK